MPPWWVYKKTTGSVATIVSSFLVCLTLQRFDCVGAVSDVLNHTVPLTTALDARFIRCQLSYCETG